jgi:hypothetical protein
MNRRDLLALLGSAAVSRAQGVSSGGVKPLPRGKPSGRPFLARFTDIAESAGLHHPVTDVTAEAGLVRTGWASAVTIGDYDNDRFPDIFITYYGHNVLYRNNGDGTFTDVTERAGLGQKTVRYGSGCTWVDYNRDGHLDRSSPTISIPPSRSSRVRLPIPIAAGRASP